MSEQPIGPNPCSVCGGEYGQHTDPCRRLHDEIDHADRSAQQSEEYFCREIERLQSQLGFARSALETLSRLGNGDLPGNSDGNQIAQDAIRKMDELATAGSRTC